MMILLSGDPGTGKTTICQEVVSLCRDRAIPCAGILSLPLVDSDGVRTGILAQDIASGARQVLARTETSGAVRVGHYTFEPDTVNWAVSALRKALKSEAQLLIIDEIGPLELWFGNGFAPVLPDIAAWERHLLIVVRDWLVPPLTRAIGATHPTCEFHLTLENRDELAEQILQTIAPPQGQGHPLAVSSRVD